jgi:large subunit ribosomal protein L25
MSETRLVAQPRTEFGKGAARRTRRAGLVPAVLYGHGTDAQHLSLSAREFARAIKGGANTVLTLEIDGKDQLALPRAVVRHPLRDYFEHVDLLIVKRGEKVHVDVPVHLTGEAVPGTLVLHELNTLAVEVDALAIPERIEVSIDGAEAGSQVLAGQVTLPDGATLVTDPEAMIVAVQVAPTAEAMEGETEATAAAEEPAEAPAAEEE